MLVTKVIEFMDDKPHWTVSMLHASMHKKFGCTKGDIRAIVF